MKKFLTCLLALSVLIGVAAIGVFCAQEHGASCRAAKQPPCVFSSIEKRQPDLIWLTVEEFNAFLECRRRYAAHCRSPWGVADQPPAKSCDCCNGKCCGACQVPGKCGCAMVRLGDKQLRCECCKSCPGRKPRDDPKKCCPEPLPMPAAK